MKSVVREKHCGECGAYYPIKAGKGMCRRYAFQPAIMRPDTTKKGFTCVAPEVEENWPACMEFVGEAIGAMPQVLKMPDLSDPV